MKPKVLILIVGSLRPGFVESIKSWEPVIDIFDNVEILYVLRDRINLIPEAVLTMHNIDFSPLFRRNRFFGYNNETNTILTNFIKDTSIIFNIPEDSLYSHPICESFLFETLPFFKTKRCSLHLIENIQVDPDSKIWSWHRTNSKNMFQGWKSASDFIISNNINFDYCIKIRPDIDYRGNLKEGKFKYIFDYCVKTNNIVLDTIFNTDLPSDQRMAGDQVAIGSRQNIMKYLQILEYNHDECDEYFNINDCHKALLYYLFKSNIIMANGDKYIQKNVRSWKLQENIHFKRFLKYNIHMPHYKDFLTLLNQFSTSL